MLTTVDVLIGFSVVMLVFSMPVTLLTQSATMLLNLRGVALMHGVVRLLVMLDRTLGPNPKKLAATLLKHPLVATQGLFGTTRIAGVVLREELARMILYFGGEGGAVDASSGKTNDQLDAAVVAAKAAVDALPPGDPKVAGAQLALKGAEAAQASYSTQGSRLRDVLIKLGIPDPDQTLADVRREQLALELAHPEMAADARATAALLTKASSDFLARFNAWFDQTMDRVAQLFALYSTVVTLVVALLIAGALQVDSIALINRLASDSATRDALVQSAIAHPERYSPVADQATIDAADADLVQANKTVGEAKITAAAAPDAAKTAALAGLENAQRDRDAIASRVSRLKLADAAATARVAATTADAELTRLKAAAAPDAEIAKQTATVAATRADADRTAASAAEFATVATQLRDDPGLARMVRLDLVEIPQDLTHWRKTFWPRLPGVLITAALLSLGGKFWYSLLSDLLKLRPLLAKKEAGQRAVRQTSQTGETPATKGTKA